MTLTRAVVSVISCHLCVSHTSHGLISHELRTEAFVRSRSTAQLMMWNDDYYYKIEQERGVATSAKVADGHRFAIDTIQRVCLPLAVLTVAHLCCCHVSSLPCGMALNDAWIFCRFQFCNFLLVLSASLPLPLPYQLVAP